GVRGCRRHVTCGKPLAEPGCEAVDAVPCDPRQPRLTHAALNWERCAGKTFRGSLVDDQRRKRAADIHQHPRVRTHRPAGWAPRFTLIEDESKGVADRNARLRDRNRPAGTQPEPPEPITGTKARDQRERPVADRRLAQADERVAGAQIETPLE